MAKTYAEIKKQIAGLAALAEKQRAAEISEVVKKIRAAVETYGLTAQDLFDAKATGPKGRKPGRAGRVKYADGKGNSWVGLGKRPQWIRDALSAGAKLEDFLGGKSVAAPIAAPDAAALPDSPGRTAPKKRRSIKASVAKKATKAKFSDGAGNSWSGRGPQPRWLKEALAAGKTLADFTA